MKDVTDDAISKAWRDHFGTMDTRSVRREVVRKLNGVTNDRDAGQIVWDVHRRYYDSGWIIQESALPGIGRTFLKAVA